MTKCTVIQCPEEATHEVYWPQWRERPDKAKKYAPTEGFVPYCFDCARQRASGWRTKNSLRPLGTHMPDLESVMWDG